MAVILSPRVRRCMPESLNGAPAISRFMDTVDMGLPRNTLLPIVSGWSLPSITTDSTVVHPLNALAPICVIDDGMVRGEDRPVHPANAFAPILATDGGRFKADSPVHPENALSAIDVTPSPMVSSVSAPCPEKG
ncbi:hypothetical protein IMSAGC006_02054 [Muribaculaceae bacterium]|nr:hypothetical protein IMSAGC006_02054 [Muribaculaceae bacterium]